jgi:uncharacterized protein YecT (DUF1311 family)
MRFRIGLCVVSLFAFAAGHAMASDAQYKACIDATGKNDEWAACGGELIKRNEAQMDAQMKRLREAADPETMKTIDIEQKAWIVFRDSACEIYSNAYNFGREGQVLSYPLCKANLVAERAEQLRDYVRQIDP